MYSVWLSDEQQRVWRGYLAMVGALEAAMNRQLQADCGLSLSDYDVLVPLSERGPLRVYELAEALSWEQSRGRAALRAAAPGHAELVRATVFDEMTATELRALRTLISRVLGRLATSPSRRSE